MSSIFLDKHSISSSSANSEIKITNLPLSNPAGSLPIVTPPVSFVEKAETETSTPKETLYSHVKERSPETPYSPEKGREYTALEDTQYFQTLLTLASQCPPEKRKLLQQLLKTLPIRARQLQDKTPSGIQTAIGSLLELMGKHPSLLTDPLGESILCDGWLQIILAIEERRQKEENTSFFFETNTVCRLLYYSHSTHTSIALKEHVNRVIGFLNGKESLPRDVISSSMTQDSSCFEPNLRCNGMTSAKQLAIDVADLIEGFDFNSGGIRLRVHQTFDRPLDLVFKQIREFESGRRNIIFENRESVPMANYRTLMLYMIKALKEDREQYYASHPEYINEATLEECIQKMKKTGQWRQIETEDRYPFEWCARELVKMEERIKKAEDDRQIAILLKEFHTVYSQISSFPNKNIDLTVCTCISHRVFSVSDVLKPVVVPGTPVPLLNLANELGAAHDPAQVAVVDLISLASVSFHCPPQIIETLEALKAAYSNLQAAKTEEEQKQVARHMLTLMKPLPQKYFGDIRRKLEMLLGMPKETFKAIRKYATFLYYSTGRPGDSHPPAEEAEMAFHKRCDDLIETLSLDYAPEEATKTVESLSVEFQALEKRFPHGAQHSSNLKGALQLLSEQQKLLDKHRKGVAPFLIGTIDQRPSIRDLNDGPLASIFEELDYLTDELSVLSKKEFFDGPGEIFEQELSQLKKNLQDCYNRTYNPLMHPLSLRSDFETLINYAKKWIRLPREELQQHVAELQRLLKKGNYNKGPVNPLEQWEEILCACQWLKDHIFTHIVEEKVNNPALWEEIPKMYSREFDYTPESLKTIGQLEASLVSKAQDYALTNKNWQRPLQLLIKIAISQGVQLPQDISTPKALQALKESLARCRKELTASYATLRDKVINSESTLASLQKNHRTGDAWSQLLIGEINSGVLGAIGRVIEHVEQKQTPRETITETAISLPGLATKTTRVIGKVRIIDPSKEFPTVNEGEIVVLPYAIPEVHKYAQASAVIIEEGGLFSHAAIDLDDEDLNIPAVIGVKRASQLLHSFEGKHVILSMGEENVIELLSPEESEIAEQTLGKGRIETADAHKIFAKAQKEIANEGVRDILIQDILHQVLASPQAVEQARDTLDKETVIRYLECRKITQQKAWKCLHTCSSPLEMEYLKRKLTRELSDDLNLQQALNLDSSGTIENLGSLASLSSEKSSSAAPLAPLGDKGQNLETLQQLLASKKEGGKTAFSVPPFMKLGHQSLAYAFFDQEISGKSLRKNILEILQSTEINSATKYKKITDLLQQAKIDEKNLKQIFETFQAQHGASPIIVRSSCTLEDQQSSAAAGLFDSIEDVTTEKEFMNAVARVWASAFSERAIGFWEQKKDTNWAQLFEMSVIVQVYEKDAEFSGVAFSVAKEHNWDIAGVQIVKGLGGGVAGTTTPTTAFVDTRLSQIADLHQPDADLPTSLQHFKDCSALVKSLEQTFGCPVEIEFAGKGNRISVVQVRPITRYTLK